MRLFISALLINDLRSGSVRVYLGAFGPPLMKDRGEGGKGGGGYLQIEQQAIFRLRLQRLLPHFSPLSLISSLSPQYLFVFGLVFFCLVV